MELSSKSSVKSNTVKKLKKENLQRLSSVDSTSGSARGSVRMRKHKGTKHRSISEWPELELSEEEERRIIVGGIGQEIIDSALKIITEQYLEKQTVYFVSHCCRLAWKALIEWNYQTKDKGSFKEIKTDLLDTEPNPSPKDSWASHSVRVGLPVSKDPTETEAVQLESKQSTPEAPEEVEEQPMTATEFMRQSLDQVTRSMTKSNKSFVQRERKDQARNVDDHSLACNTSTVRTTTGEVIRRESYEPPSPTVLQARFFPTSRVDVQYAIAPSGRGHAQRKAPTVKTVNL